MTEKSAKNMRSWLITFNVTLGISSRPKAKPKAKPRPTYQMVQNSSSRSSCRTEYVEAGAGDGDDVGLPDPVSEIEPEPSKQWQKQKSVDVRAGRRQSTSIKFLAMRRIMRPAARPTTARCCRINFLAEKGILKMPINTLK